MRVAGVRLDLIFEAVTAPPDLIQHYIHIVPPRVLVVVIGVCIELDTIIPREIVSKDQELTVVLGYAMQDYGFPLSMAGKGRIKSEMMVTHQVSLDGLPAAFEALKTPTDHCKAMLVSLCTVWTIPAGLKNPTGDNQ